MSDRINSIIVALENYLREDDCQSIVDAISMIKGVASCKTMKTPNYRVIEITKDLVLLQDIGPWDLYPSITNGVEKVVELVFPLLQGRRLEYIDSEGERDEIVVTPDGEFQEFRFIKR